MIPRRLFFALTIETPWPEEFPEGRVLREENRHVTVAFLGSRDEEVEDLISKVPDFPFSVAPSGVFVDSLFLPEENPKVAAWEIEWLTETEGIISWQKDLETALGIKRRNKDFLFHLTLCRAPKKLADWQRAFAALPLYCKELHLFESLGNSDYKSLWSQEFLAPFTEISHTADIAYLVRGKNYFDLYVHAALALAFLCPEFLKEIEKEIVLEDLSSVITALNRCLARVDAKYGAEFKAVSYGGIVEEKENYLEWEMIVDV